MIEPASERDLEIMAAQLGRTMRGVLGIGARCACGDCRAAFTSNGRHGSRHPAHRDKRGAGAHRLSEVTRVTRPRAAPPAPPTVPDGLSVPPEVMHVNQG